MAGQATKSRQNKSANSAGGEQYLPEHLAFEMARVVEEAAIAAARTMGQDDRPGSDQPLCKPCAALLKKCPSPEIS